MICAHPICSNRFYNKNLRTLFTLAWFNEIIIQQILNFFRKTFLDCSFHTGVVLQVVNPQRITKTRLYNFDLLKPHFYIVKLGFTGVYIIFLILLKNIDCGYSLEPPRRGGSNEYPQSMF